jgi:PPOX class probable F420-dependent enzyme
MNKLEQFANQKFLNLETFRKNGESMKTPVWFTQEGETIYVRTVDGSGKVKRVRNNGNVNIAPCKVDGVLVGEWVPATARQVRDPQIDQKVGRLISKKYGLMATILALRSRFRRNEYAILEIKLNK